MEKSNKKIYIILICALVLSLAANLFSLFSYFSAGKQDDLSSAAKYPLLNPVRGLVKKEDLIVNIQPLRDEFNKFENDKNISIYFEYLNTGANISINKDAEFWPASLLKVPVTIAVAKKIELGAWRWDNKLVLMAGDKDEKFGTLYRQPTGTTFTIEELVRRALADSDNTANYILVRNLELKEIEDVYEHIGASDFFSAAGNIGAKKYSANFRALYNSSYLSEEYSQKLLDNLSRTEFNEYLKSGLPENITFAHKIGVADDRKVYMDSGIVYVPNRPYILTVMVSGQEKQEAEKLMKNIAEQSLNYINNYKEN